MRDEFGADFVAAGADAWADGGEKVGRIRMEAGVQFADGFFEDTGERTAPARMDGGDGAFFGIDEEDRDTVGGLDSEQETGSFCERGVTLAGLARGRFEGPDDSGVDLFEDDERGFLRAEGGLEFFTIFEDVFARVPVGEAEVEDFFPVKLRDAAGGCTEAVDEPGKFGEGFKLEKL